MLKYQRRILEKNLPYLLEELVIDETFIACVTSKELLPQECIEDIQAALTQGKKIMLFVERLKKRPPESFNDFLNILKLSEQDHIFRELNYCRHQMIKDLPKSPAIDENMKAHLNRDLLPGRLLSTKEKEVLHQHYVLRSDYNNINEEKHILQQKQKELEGEVEQQKDIASLETRHHKYKQDELHIEQTKYQNLKKEFEALKEQLQKLKADNERLENEKKELIDKHKAEIEELQQMLATYQNNVQLLPEADSDGTVTGTNMETEDSETLHGDHSIHSEMSVKLEQIKHLWEEMDKSRAEVSEFQKNVSETLTDLERQLVDFSNGVMRVAPEDMTQAMDEEVADSEIDEKGSHATDTNNQVMRNSSPPAAKRCRKPKRHAVHTKGHNQVINLETDIHTMKTKLKNMEERLLEANEANEQKNKLLRENERKINQLRLDLRQQRDKESARMAVQQQPGTYPHNSGDYHHGTTPRCLRQKQMPAKLQGVAPSSTTVSCEVIDLKWGKPLIKNSVIHNGKDLSLDTSCLTTMAGHKQAKRK